MEIVIPGAANLGLFVSAALVLLLIPGPAVLYIVGRSVEQGRLAGLVSLAGIHAATLVHVAGRGAWACRHCSPRPPWRSASSNMRVRPT